MPANWEITRLYIFELQVCVPKTASDEEVIAFVEKTNDIDLENNRSYSIRREGHKYLGGDPERAQCEEHPDNCHIMLEY